MIPRTEYLKFQKDYYANPNNLRYGQTFCNRFFPDHSCMNGCEIERIFYAKEDIIAQNLIINYIDWSR